MEEAVRPGALGCAQCPPNGAGGQGAYSGLEGFLEEAEHK